MASSPITSWQIDMETWKQQHTLLSWTLKSLQMVTAAVKLKGACSLEEKLLQNLKKKKKSREITLPTKVHLVKATVFPIGRYGYERWTTMKADHQRTDVSELWCWRILLRVSWTAKTSTQSTVKEINPEYLLEELMLKQKLQYFGYLMQGNNSLENTLMLGKIEGRRRME